MRAASTLLALALLPALVGAVSCSFPEFKELTGHPELCTDGLPNADESDADCGGPDCEPCSQSRQCQAPRDCLSRSCAGNVCQPPSCSDGVKNGTESGRDCGGNCATQKCSADEGCIGGTDCESQVCTQGLCQAPTCGDHTLNGGESDGDCGGGTCPACDDGMRCNVNTDCGNNLCDQNTCVPTPRRTLEIWE